MPCSHWTGFFAETVDYIPMGKSYRQSKSSPCEHGFREIVKEKCIPRPHNLTREALEHNQNNSYNKGVLVIILVRSTGDLKL